MVNCVIKNRFTDEVIFSGEAESFKQFVESKIVSRADLSRANLSRVDLSGADLSGADIDYSSIPFCCSSLRAKFDDKIRIQYLYHAVKTSGDVVDVDLKELFESELFKKVVNKFHRVKECGRIE